MRKWMALMLVMVLLVPTLGLAEGSTLTAEQKQEDITFLKTELEQKHYDLYALIDQAQWEAEIAQAEAAAPGQTDMDFCLSLMELVASLGDSHTRAGLVGGMKEQLGALPMQFMWFEGGLYLVAATKEYEPYLGQKLAGIAGLDVPELMERFRGLISYDNETWYRSQFAQYLIGVEYLAYLGIIEDTEAVEVAFEDAEGTRSDVSVKSEYGELYNLEFAVVERAQIPLAQQAASIYYTTELSEDALMISYHSCQEDPNLPMATFIEQVQAQLADGTYQKVLVDLRYNGGGNSSIFEPMIEMLGEMKAEQGFSLYAMVGSGTYSSALMNAVQIKMRAGAIVVGKPTGGSVNAYGEILMMELPNAEVTVTYSTKFFGMIPSYGIESLMPDVEVPTSFDDFMQGVDPEIEYILAT